ncbi:hypothetical protein [Comamonas sp.]|uniref:hypothetical protein n=1 Tax=Comamonas sp. TaxID=34028 RepID=UPI00289961EF|nr:hypothetical protein [Comamonas sp.]
MFGVATRHFQQKLAALSACVFLRIHMNSTFMPLTGGAKRPAASVPLLGMAILHLYMAYSM